jgi:hypothetical protein
VELQQSHVLKTLNYAANSKQKSVPIIFKQKPAETSTIELEAERSKYMTSLIMRDREWNHCQCLGCSKFKYADMYPTLDKTNHQGCHKCGCLANICWCFTSIASNVERSEKETEFYQLIIFDVSRLKYDPEWSSEKLCSKIINSSAQSTSSSSITPLSEISNTTLTSLTDDIHTIKDKYVKLWSLENGQEVIGKNPTAKAKHYTPSQDDNVTTSSEFWLTDIYDDKVKLVVGEKCVQTGGDISTCYCIKCSGG